MSCRLCCIITNLGTVADIRKTWQGEQIPLAARIVAVADAYDAMSSDRPYREGMSEEKIEQILRSGAGKQWDPQVIDAFFKAREDIHKIIPK